MTHSSSSSPSDQTPTTLFSQATVSTLPTNQDGLRAHHGDARLERGLQGLGDLLSRHTLAIPVLDSYTYSVPRALPDPTQELWNRIRIGEKQRNLHQGRSRAISMVYANKIEEEMEVITEAGMSRYLVMAAIIHRLDAGQQGAVSDTWFSGGFPGVLPPWNQQCGSPQVGPEKLREVPQQGQDQAPRRQPRHRPRPS